jgi:aspartyl-tRNA(Asn)/glutamyl-tRNA(Gln) amidotransferase subunit A
VDALKERHTVSQRLAFAPELDVPRQLRIGVATNFKADTEVAAAFGGAVEIVARLGHIMKETAVPFAGPATGIRHIERDRKTIAGQLFTEIDVLLLPTTTSTVPRAAAATPDPQALSPENTVFANYFGLPAISVPCGFDSSGLPVGLQIVAGPWADLNVLVVARQYERTAGWFSKHPTVTPDWPHPTAGRDENAAKRYRVLTYA